MAAVYLTEDKIKDVQALYTKVLNNEDYASNTKAINKIMKTFDSATYEYVRQIMKSMRKTHYSN